MAVFEGGMRRLGPGFLFAAVMSGAAWAQVRERWHLDYEMTGKPQIYSLRSPLDQLTNYWYFTYTVTNNTGSQVPLIIDTMLYIETTKSMQHDVDKVSVPKAKTVFEPNIPYTRPYERNLYGRFYSSTIFPEAEYDIIIKDVRMRRAPRDKLTNDHVAAILGGNRGIQEEAILNFKRAFMYLNPREMRQKGWIQPGEKVHALAIFTGVDPRANVIEIHISGLWDVFKVLKVTDEDVELAYENRVLREIYEFPGDAFYREQDVLLPPPKKEWLAKRIGPVASRETIDNLVQMMVDYLKFEGDSRVKNLDPKEMEDKRRARGILPVDIIVASRIFETAVGRSFRYDPDKDPYENRNAIARMHEFWLSNKSKLAYDTAKNQYVVKEDVLPGKTNVKREK